MTGLVYVGKTPSEDRDIQNRLQTENQFATGTTRSYVDGRALELAGPYATQVYVNTQDQLYAEPSYYQSQDNLLIPNSAKGVANGVATLGADGKIPVGQMANLGAGNFKASGLPTATYTGTTDQTPMKIADWQLGLLAVNCQIQIFLVAVVKTSGWGRPVIEVRASKTGSTTYASQALVARGWGRGQCNGRQVVTLVSARPEGTKPTTFFSASDTVNLSAWLFDDGRIMSGQHEMEDNMLAISSVWLMRIAM